MAQVSTNLPPEQQAIRTKCIHLTGTFVEFKKEDVEQSIPARFEKIVAQYPHHVAVKMGDRALTYDQLNRAANRIAHAILEKDGQNSEPIALLFEHGIDVIVAIFAVLKASKFYLGIDLSFPQHRIAQMLENSGAGLIVTNGRNLELARSIAKDSRSLLNADEISNSTSSENPGLTIATEKFACLLYTSGSTGNPKGIVCPHRNIVFNAVIHGHVNHIRVADRLTLLHSVSFGSSHINLFQSLLNGASLYPFDIKSEGTLRLPAWLNEEQITVFHSPPVVFRQLAETLSGHEKISTLRLINLSGAPVSKLDIDLYRGHFLPKAVLEISMGSTETHTFSSFVVNQDFKFPDRGVPVGYPRPGREVLIVDENGNTLEPGQVGEIAVRSRYLNLPFAHDPNTTIDNFNFDPKAGGERIYLTGDLGRMMPDGFLIHVGRKDFVSKVRGYRVSLVEIEEALLDHSGVMEAAVVAWDNDAGEKQLAAYVVPRNDSILTVREIANFLRAKLPTYMIPSTFMFLKNLPQTNGKVDRRALPRPRRMRPRLGNAYAAPRNESEQQLVGLWQDVLDIRPIGIHDNFFDLGGHSLAASRIISRVIRLFQLELPLKALFESPTVAEMAAVIDEHQKNRLTEEELERILTELETMSEEEAKKLGGVHDK